MYIAFKLSKPSTSVVPSAVHLVLRLEGRRPDDRPKSSLCPNRLGNAEKTVSLSVGCYSRAWRALADGDE